LSLPYRFLCLQHIDGYTRCKAPLSKDFNWCLAWHFLFSRDWILVQYWCMKPFWRTDRRLRSGNLRIGLAFRRIKRPVLRDKALLLLELSYIRCTTATCGMDRFGTMPPRGDA